MHIPQFLGQLGLGTDADLREIRRAYAKQIKLLDAELQPGEFQALREAYAQATAWAEWQAHINAFETRQDGPATDDVAAPPSPLPPPTSATAAQPVQADLTADIADGSAVFAEFIANRRREVAPPLDETGWAAALRTQLDDTRLIGLETRAAFEHALASYLAAGWKPGNEMLFLAAIETFQWDQGRSGLNHFGATGMRLNRAITEWEILRRRGGTKPNRELELLARMRDDTPPSEYEALYYKNLLPHMSRQFGTLLPIATNMANAAHWQAPAPLPASAILVSTSAAGNRSPAPNPIYLNQPGSLLVRNVPRRFPSWALVTLVLLAPCLFVAFALFSLGGEKTDDEDHADHASAPAMQRTTPVAIPITLPSPGDHELHPLLQEAQAAQLTAMIRPNIVFRKSKPSPGEHLPRVRYLISVDERGLPTATVLEGSSGSQDFDLAVGHAIAFSGPYPRTLIAPGAPVLYSIGPEQL